MRAAATAEMTSGRAEGVEYATVDVQGFARDRVKRLEQWLASCALESTDEPALVGTEGQRDRRFPRLSCLLFV